MKSDADLFSNAVSRIGKKRLPDSTFSQERFGSTLSDIRHTVSERIENFRANGKTVRVMPPVLFDYTDDPYLDAFAFQDDSRGYIALSGCGVAVLHAAMFRLLSRPDVMWDVGDPSMEDGSLPFIPLTLDFRELAMSLADAGLTLSFFIPRNEIRALTARVMAKLAVEFVVAHEFRHIQAGHVEDWRKVTGHPFLCELNHSEPTPSEAMISQAMEMDADCYGIATIVRQVLLINSPSSKFKDGWRAAMPNDESAAFLPLLAAYGGFKLFAHVDKTSQNWLERSHPPPAMRNQMLMATVHECFIRWNRPDLGEWLPIAIPRIIDIGERQIGILL